MKIIFLDIDGVLVTFQNKRQLINEEKSLLHTRKLDHNLMLNLAYLIETTGANIVISSSWRRWLWKELRDEFYRYYDETWVDLWARIISKIPHSLNGWRGNEILWWINEHHKTCRVWDHVTDWVSIDHSKEHQKVINRWWLLVQTRLQEWLTRDKMEEAISILN